MFHLLIFDSFYNKEFIQYLVPLDGEVVLAYCSVLGPEIDFHLLRFCFKVNLSKIELTYLYICTE